jgi:hypothetical protein
MGKILYQNCSLYVPTTSIKEKHLDLKCNRILTPKSNRCGPKTHEGSSASTQYTTKRLFFKLGSWHHKRGDRHTHTHTHWQHMTTQCNDITIHSSSHENLSITIVLSSRGTKNNIFPRDTTSRSVLPIRPIRRWQWNLSQKICSLLQPCC